MNRLPNIVLIMTDQQRADLSAREGFALDTTPFLDGLAREGVWFNPRGRAAQQVDEKTGLHEARVQQASRPEEERQRQVAQQRGLRRCPLGEEPLPRDRGPARLLLRDGTWGRTGTGPDRRGEAV